MRLRRWLNLFCAVSLGGCALLPPTPQSDHILQSGDLSTPRSAQVTDVPIVLQEPDYCGPAALAMAMGHLGIKVQQQELADRVFLPNRAGSLQQEMQAGPRHWQLATYALDGQIETLLQAVSHNTPPIVLLNLGLDWAPKWHYAVVIGFDLNKQELLLRSGTHAEQAFSLRTFEYTWARSHHWAMVVTRPDHIPPYVQAVAAEKGVIGFERLQGSSASLALWQVANHRWPERVAPAIGLSNAYIQTGHMDQAIALLESQSSRLNHPALWNNLADVYRQSGRMDSAKNALCKGFSSPEAKRSQWQDLLQQTLQSLPNNYPCQP